MGGGIVNNGRRTIDPRGRRTPGENAGLECTPDPDDRTVFLGVRENMSKTPPVASRSSV
tara:strand:+ start:231 stop:407 length:177 start_codon:yes stop_codon:yes gene_type:complete